MKHRAESSLPGASVGRDPFREVVHPILSPISASSELRPAGETAALRRRKIVWLDESYLSQVLELEPQCYSHAWSAELIRGEFAKQVSFRWGIVAADAASRVNGQTRREPDEAVERPPSVLRGYCFSYLVVDELHILNLAVDPRHQGRGIGRTLLTSVLDLGAGRGASFATLEVRKSNSVAQLLYQSVGFKQVGTRKAYYRDNGEDALVLERSLS